MAVSAAMAGWLIYQWENCVCGMKEMTQLNNEEAEMQPS
jgi:hypothetical protein